MYELEKGRNCELIDEALDHIPAELALEEAVDLSLRCVIPSVSIQ